jgi:hypothetical protein
MLSNPVQQTRKSGAPKGVLAYFGLYYCSVSKTIEFIHVSLFDIESCRDRIANGSSCAGGNIASRQPEG